MDPTVVVAGMGFAATLLGAWMTGRTQRLAAHDERILDAKVRTFGECSDSLYEYQRATMNRAKARMAAPPAVARDALRQEAYRANTRVRSAIGQVAILSGNESLHARLERARESVSALKDAEHEEELQSLWAISQKQLIEALEQTRGELMLGSGAPWPWTRDR